MSRQTQHTPRKEISAAANQNQERPVARIVSLHGNEEEAAAREQRNADAAIAHDHRRLGERTETEAEYHALLDWIDPGAEIYERAVEAEMRDPDKGAGLAVIRQAHREASLLGAKRTA
jgi:hypothetical protein